MPLDPRPPQLAALNPGGWQVLAMTLFNVTLPQAFGTLGGVDLFAAPRTSWRVCLNGQTDPAENGIYGIASSPTGDLLNSQNTPGDINTALNITVTPGAVYRYDHTSQVVRLVNGDAELTESGYFVAKGGYVSLYASQYFLGVPLTARIYPCVFARTTDADSNEDWNYGVGGHRVEVLSGPQAGLWEVDRTPSFTFGGSPITFSRLGNVAVSGGDPAATATAVGPTLNGNPVKDFGYDGRGPQGPQPPRPVGPAKSDSGGDSVDMPTQAGPSVSLLGIPTIVTINSSPVTVGYEAVTCLF
jgi:hypothetical protein